MKKKILLLLIAFFVLISLTGCKKKTNNEKTNADEKPTIKVKDKEIDLNQENHFEKMYFKESSLFQSSTVNNNRIISYKDGSKTIFEIRMAYLDNKTLEESKKELTFDTSNKRVGNEKYLYGEWEMTDKESGKKYKVHQYFYEYKKSTYTISFITNEDIDRFENAFMSTVYFK